MLFNIDENTVISVLCDLPTGHLVDEMQAYLSQQVFNNYHFVVLPEGYSDSTAGQCKNALLWSMTSNLFVFASAIDLKDPLFISNLVNRFLLNRKLALLVRLDSTYVPEFQTSDRLSKPLILDLADQVLKGGGGFGSSTLRIIGGYKSVIKPAGWYKDQLKFYEDLNLAYRVLTKYDVSIEIVSVELKSNRKIDSEELMLCFDKIMYVERDDSLRTQCKRLKKLVEKNRGVYGS